MAARVYGSEKRVIILGDVEIKYELTRKSVKNVNLRIDAAGTVKVSASRRVPVDYIEGFMRQKQALIVAAVDRAEQNSRRQLEQKPQLPRRYEDGEQLALLGRKRTVKLVQVFKAGSERIDLEEDLMYFRVRDPGDVRHKELMYEKWLKAYQDRKSVV